jgi:hypothetical protein
MALARRYTSNQLYRRGLGSSTGGDEERVEFGHRTTVPKSGALTLWKGNARARTSRRRPRRSLASGVLRAHTNSTDSSDRQSRSCPVGHHPHFDHREAAQVIRSWRGCLVRQAELRVLKAHEIEDRLCIFGPQVQTSRLTAHAPDGAPRNRDERAAGDAQALGGLAQKLNDEGEGPLNCARSFCGCGSGSSRSPAA